MTRGQGFTLLEVLVVLVISGVLLATLAAAAHVGRTALDAMDRITTRNEDLVVVDRAFRTLVSHATGGTVEVDTPFRGAPHSMAFTTSLTGAATPVSTGAADVSLAVDRRHRLVVLWAPHYTKPASTPPPSTMAVLVEAVDQVDFGYLPDGETSWQSVWARDGLPALVRLHIRLLRPKDRHLPDIVAQTQLRDRVW